MIVRRAALALGLLLVGLTVLFAVPGNGLFESKHHQIEATILANVAMLMVLWGAFPAIRGVVARLAHVPATMLGYALAIAVVAPLVVLSALRVVAPRATHQLITREWGVVEPLQLVFYVTALFLCLTVRGHVRPDDRERRLYEAGAATIVVFILEEIDYLGLFTFLARVAGAPEGRLGRKHIGGLHDLLDVATQRVGITVVAAGGLVALAVIVACLRRELRRPSAVPLAVFAAGFLLAQAIDFDDQLLPEWMGVRILEESLELVAVLALNAALILRVREAQVESRVSSPARD